MSAWSISARQKYTGALLYCLHPLSIVYIMGSILSFVESCLDTHVRGRHGSSEATPWVLPGDEPARVEEFRRTSTLCVSAPYERIRPVSKVKIDVRLSVCLCQIFAHQFNLVTFNRQNGGSKLYYGKLRCHFK